MSVLHKFVSTKPDAPDTSLVNPSNWNAEHVDQFGNSINISVGSGIQSFYLQDTDSDVSASKKLLPTPYTPKATLSFSSVGIGTTLLKKWITEPGVPNLTFIPAGSFEFHIHASQGGTIFPVKLYAEIWETDASGVDITKIGTSEISNTLGSTEEEYRLYFVTSDVYNMQSASSRIVVKVYVVITGSVSFASINLYYGDEADSHIAIPSNEIGGVGGGGSPGYVPYWSAAEELSYDAQGMFWDAIDHRLGIGVIPPGPAYSSVGSTFNRGDFTAINAFFWSSLDLSPYAGMDVGSTPYYIEVLDGAGKKATGYIAGVGAGETLGDELLVNGDFASAEPPGSAWTREAGWTIAGGVGVATAVAFNGAMYQFPSIAVNMLYKISFDIASLASGAFFYGLQGGADLSIAGPDQTGIGTHVGYFTSRSWDLAALRGTQVSPPTTGTIDNASIRRVTDPPSTTVHIVDSLNGTTRNWASIESGFDPNTIASWIIYSNVTTHIIPHSTLAVGQIPIYASNALAITGGLTVGDFYRTGGDPDNVCIVH